MSTFDGLFDAIDRMHGWISIFAWKNLRDYQATFRMEAQVSDQLRLRAGYSHFFHGRFIRRTGTSPPADRVHLRTMWEY